MTTALLVLARSVHIGAAMLLLALPFFSFAILRTVGASALAEDYSRFRETMSKWLWSAFVTELISGALWFWLVAADMNDQAPWSIIAVADLETVLSQTEFGHLWLLRAVIAVAWGVAFYFAGRTKTFSLKRANFLSGIVLIFAACLLLSLAWAGHAVAGVHDRALHLFVDVVHLLIGAIWPMGLIPLIWFLRHIETQQSAGVAESEIAVLRRSSRLSFIAVLLLVGTGTVNGWLMIGSWTALVTTLYGGLLLGKVFIVGVMIGLGAFNRCRLLPRIPNAPQTIRRLRQTVFAECCLILIVLVIVGIMGMTSPPS